MRMFRTFVDIPNELLQAGFVALCLAYDLESLDQAEACSITS